MVTRLSRQAGRRYTQMGSSEGSNGFVSWLGAKGSTTAAVVTAVVAQFVRLMGNPSFFRAGQAP